MRRLYRASFITMTVGCLAGVAAGAPSGLNIIPTADVLAAGEMSLEHEMTGQGRLWGDDSDSFGLLQFGLGRGIEVGVDRGFDPRDWWGNAKWQVQPEDAGKPAVALGIQGLSDGDRAQPYVVMTRSLNALRLHAGAIVIEDDLRWMAGTEVPLGTHLVFQADYTSGRDNSWSYGVAAALSDNVSLTVAHRLGNSGAVDDGYIFNLAWSVRLD